LLKKFVAALQKTMLDLSKVGFSLLALERFIDESEVLIVEDFIPTKIAVTEKRRLINEKTSKRTHVAKPHKSQ
jgi:hypothetical protein